MLTSEEIERLEALLSPVPRINANCTRCKGSGQHDEVSPWSLNRITVECSACAFTRVDRVSQAQAALLASAPALLAAAKENAAVRDVIVAADQDYGDGPIEPVDVVRRLIAEKAKLRKALARALDFLSDANDIIRDENVTDDEECDEMDDRICGWRDQFGLVAATRALEG